MAFIRNPLKAFPEYKSTETAAAFLQNLWVPTHGGFALDWDSDSDDAGLIAGSDTDSDVGVD